VGLNGSSGGGARGRWPKSMDLTLLLHHVRAESVHRIEKTKNK